MRDHGQGRRNHGRHTILMKAVLAALAFVATLATARTSHAIVRPPGVALWPGGIVRVCWQTQRSTDGGGNPVNPHTRADWAVLSNVVRDTMRNTWGRVANIEFTGFGDCTSNASTALGGWVAINLALPPCGNAAQCPQNGNTGIGYYASNWNGMRLNPDLNGATSDDFRAQVMHETGHALGFEHEFTRVDNPRNSGCAYDADPANIVGTTYGTPFDYPSIMNYSYDWNCPPAKSVPRPFRLSAYDIVGVQAAYGLHSAGQLVAQSGGCMNIPMPYSPGGALQTYECQQNGANSIWQLRANDSLISDPFYAAFIDVPWAQSSPGVTLDTNNMNSPPSGNQIWHPRDGYQIKGIGETCLDIPNGNIANGQRVQIYTCHGGWNQQWRAYADGTIRPASNSGYCLDVPGGWNSPGNVLQLWQCWGGVNQQFRFDNNGEIIFNVPGGNCLNVQTGTPSPGNAVQLYSCNGGANELWHLTMAIRGTNGLCVESQGSSSANHTPIIQNTCSSAPGQQWDYYVYNFNGFN
jgi:hypothetical protein